MDRLVLIGAACCALSLHAADVSLRVKPTAIGGVYTIGATPTVTLSSNVAEKVVWRLLDWRREKLSIGEWPKDGKLSFPGLPQGYYYVQTRIVSADGKEKIALRDCTFCIVADPKTRTFSRDSFYGVDAALSWVSAPNNYAAVWSDGNTYRSSLDLIRLCGLPHVRERLTWSEVSKNPGEYDWGKYLENARFARERGITLSGVFHDAPKYAKRDGKGPVDPGTVYRFCRDVGRAFGTAMGDWEFWNEPDISFWPDSAWDFASASKAAYLGFRAAVPGMLVLNGAMAYTTKGTMSDTLFSNDLAKYTNVLNCHAYGPPAQWADFFAELRPFMERFGLGDRQVWFTESSTNIEGESDGEGLTPGFKAHSYWQELVLAELYAKNSSYMQMEGLAHNYFFVFGPYNERGGRKDWGVQRRDGSVKLVYSAIATMTEHLATAKLEGEKNAGEGVKCFVFRQPDGSQSVACWSVSPVDEAKSPTAYVTDKQMLDIPKTCTLAVKDGTYPTASWCGTKGTVEARDGCLTLPVSRYATFVDGLSGLAVDVPARPTGRIVDDPPAADEDLTVVTAIDFAKADFRVTKSEAGLDGDRGAVTLRLWNFSDREKKGRLLVEGASIEGLPEEIVLPADGREVTLPATLRITDWSNTVTRLTVSGVFDGRRISKLFVPVRSDKMLLSISEVVDLDVNRPEFWKRNDSASETKISWDEQEKAVRFDLEWKDPKTDRWFYPQHFFRDRAESFDGATHLDCEVRMVSNKMENDVLCSHCMLYRKGEHVQYCDIKPATDFWEKRRVILTDATGKALGDGKDAFSIGFNPFGTKVTFWIRNLKLFKKKNTRLKVLMIGNSFSFRLVKSMPPVAKAMGLGLDVCSLHIGGCSLERHWGNVCASNLTPYSVTRSIDGCLQKEFKGNIPQVLKMEEWDVVTIQQASHLSWKPETYHPFGDDLVKYVRENARSAKLVVQETWSYTPWDYRLASWKIDQSAMYLRLHDAYSTFAQLHGLEVIPTGTAVQLWRQRLPVRYAENSLGGDVVGSATFEEKDGKWYPKGDVFHMGESGDYLQALVWTAKLFGVDVTKCTYKPTKMDPEQAELLRAVAMESILSGRDLD